jgi:polysaccharide biosynthesis protein PslA
MRLNQMKKRAIRQLVLLDYAAAALAWFTLWLYRQHMLTGYDYVDTLQLFHTRDYLITLVYIPLGWLFAYLMSGTYFDLYRKSRLNEINRTLISCIIACIVVSMIVFAKDRGDYSNFINEFGHYLLIHTAFALIFRLWALYRVKVNLAKGRVGFNTLIIGGNQQAINIYKQVKDNPRALGNIFCGFIYSNKESSNGMSKFLPQLGHISKLEEIIDQNEIEEVIVAVDSSEHHLLEDIQACGGEGAARLL